MLDFIISMFVVVDVGRILGAVHVIIKRLERVSVIKNRRINHNQSLNEQIVDTVQADVRELNKADNLIKKLKELLEV